jgi:SAM-dependent methyltransferase
MLDVLKKINSTQIARTKEENLEVFEKGWKENFEAIKRKGITSDNLKPAYFRPGKFLRFNNRLIISGNLNLEYDLFTLARRLILHKYLSSFTTVYEIGCGSCQNLFMLSELYPQKNLFGLDWSTTSVEIADYIASSLERNIKGELFDMLNPPMEKPIKRGSAIITIHSLEQIGTEHGKLLSFLLKSRPGLVVHYEPILEFYDENNLLDYLAIIYSKKRNYLDGYFTSLRNLQEQNKIKIIEARRPFLGGVIHEASLIVWRPR